MKLKLLIAAMLISLFGYSQQIGKVQGVSLNYVKDVFIITYNDIKFTHVQSIKYIELDSLEFTNVSNYIEQGFKDLKNVRIDTDEYILELEYSKYLGVVNLQITHFDKRTEIIGLTKFITYKSYLKIFGKL